MMSCRTAGGLTVRGRSGWRVVSSSPPRQMLDVAQVLQVGTGNASHNRIPMRPGPGTALMLSGPISPSTADGPAGEPSAP